MKAKANAYENGGFRTFVDKTKEWLKNSNISEGNWSGDEQSLETTAMMCYLSGISNHPDVLFEHLQGMIDKDAPTFPEVSTNVCSKKDDFILECTIKGKPCEDPIYTIIGEEKVELNVGPYATIERVSDPNYCQCFTIKSVSC